MTEYDYSPEAVDAYLRKQQQIARWVDKTNDYPLRDPYTPATPAAGLARKLDDEPRRRHGTSDRRDRPRERERDRDREVPRERDRDRERERERERDRHRERERQSEQRSSKPHSKRHRSASHSGPISSSRPDPQRSYTVPPPLPLPPYPFQQAPIGGYAYPPKFTSPKESRHSSRSSSTTRIPQIPSPTSYFPQQPAPYSAPAYGSMRPVRAQTSPAAYNIYPYDAKYPPSSSASSPYFHGSNPSGYPNMSPPQKTFDWASAPQYPHSMYQPNKPPPLLKRLFMSLTGSNKQNSLLKKGPRRKRSTSF